MNCNPRTMLKVAAGLGAILAIAYFALPGAQAFVLASAPVLLALICPVMMLVMVFTMKGKASSESCESTQPDAPARTEPRDAAPGKA